MHQKTYINNQFRIKIYSNSQRITRLVDNFLDFGKGCGARPGITIRFYLDEFPDGTAADNSAKLNYPNFLEKKKKLVAYFGNTTATTTIDPGSGVVRAAVYDYRESSKEALLDFIFSAPLQFILAHHGLFFMHASSVSRGGDCILIQGDQDSGKSTLALTLARSGFDFLSDDDCFIALSGNQVRLAPFPTKIGLHDKVIDRLPGISKYAISNYRYGKKKRFSLRSLCRVVTDVRAPRCRIILFPRYEKRKQVSLKRVNSDLALSRLAKANRLFYSREKYKKVQARAFWTLYRLTRDAESFELRYNDATLYRIPAVLGRLLQRISG